MRKNTEVKGLIIEKTKELIRKNPNLTIKDIAEECYVNIAAINYYFGSKDNLIAIAANDITVLRAYLGSSGYCTGSSQAIHRQGRHSVSATDYLPQWNVP